MIFSKGFEPWKFFFSATHLLHFGILDVSFLASFDVAQFGGLE